MKRWNTTLAACALGLALAGPAPAQPGAAACRDDVARLCADAPEGRRGVASCLKAHRDELSPACRTRVDARAEKRRRMQRAREACQEDVRELCGEIDSARDRMACLRSHGDALSPACREALP